MIPVAYIVHELPERIRLRVLEERGSPAYFTELIRQLGGCPGVSRASANPGTGSVVINYAGAFSEIAAFAEKRGLFTVQGPAEASERFPQGVSTGLKWLDGQLLQLSEGKFDVRSTLLLGLLVLSAVQIARGEIMVPALTLLWYALQLTGISGADDPDAGGQSPK